MADPGDSVTHWLQQSTAGENSAVEKLWERYYQKIVSMARNRLQNNRAGSLDGEDLAITVLTSFFSGIRNGRIKTVQDREHLWRLLELITQRQAVDLIRRVNAAKRTGNHAVGTDGTREKPTVNHAMDELVDERHSPALIAELNDEFRSLLSKLPGDEFREIVQAKLDGHTNQEIAASLGKSLRSIERKIRMIKDVWQGEANA